MFLLLLVSASHGVLISKRSDADDLFEHGLLGLVQVLRARADPVFAFVLQRS